MEVRRAGPGDVEHVAPLFDAYRQFYELRTDLSGARAFLAARLDGGDAVVFFAQEAGDTLGFTLLYPVFSSLAMGPALILNDLFVVPKARGKGVGRALLDRAAQYGRETGAHAIELATATSNRTAQRLYESLGYVRDDAFHHYTLTL